MKILDPSAPTVPRWALLSLAFRPLYLSAALGITILIPLWLWSLHGGWTPVSGLAPMYWHAHEMLFGVMGAVIVGFLFTAGKTWTGLQTPRGGELAAFVLVWIAARLTAILTPYPVFFFFDVVFLPAAALRFADLLWRAGNHRNLPVAAVLGMLGLANLVFHLRVAGVLEGGPLPALHAGLAVLVVMTSLIGGRVIPFFTRNATGREIVVPLHVDRAAMTLTPAGLLAWAAGWHAMPTSALLLLAACAHVLRLWHWRPLAGRGNPLLWALPLAYAWIPVALVLLAFAPWHAGLAAAGVHGLAVGAAGGLIIAMMTRTARGHTGRPLRASPAETMAYLLTFASAVLRVSAPGLPPTLEGAAIHLAGLFFAVAFLIYAIVFAPWLFTPRADGRTD